MAIWKNFRTCTESVILHRVIVNMLVLTVLSTASGCFNLQPPKPHKMYSGPELDRSEVVVISGNHRPSLERLCGDHHLHIACVDGNCSEGDCASGPTGWDQVAVLPGKHEITMCYRWRRVVQTGITIQAYIVTASPSFELNAEKHRSYWVRLPQGPERDLWRSIWVEDMRTRTEAPIRRLD